jgi:hypothetical protein
VRRQVDDHAHIADARGERPARRQKIWKILPSSPASSLALRACMAGLKRMMWPTITGGPLSSPD